MPDLDVQPPSVDARSRGIMAHLTQYRLDREYVERQVLPLATSVDGHFFELRASLHGLALKRGGYVVLETVDGPRLGQVTELGVEAHTVDGGGSSGLGSAVRISVARGTGLVLDSSGAPFHDAAVRPASSAEVSVWTSQAQPDRAGLTVGELLLAPGVPATLDSGGLARHTFMCGQSGSGKTYSLGVLLERVLAETSLRVVVIDPNSDYVGLCDVRDGADEALSLRYAGASAEVAVWRNDPGAEHPLRLQFSDLGPAAQAAVLGLRPVEDRDEYAVLTDLLHHRRDGSPLISGIGQLMSDDRPGARELGIRAANLGVLDWSVWSGGASPSLVDELREPTARCTVVDTGSLDTVPEQRLVSEAVLETLWQDRASHRPCLIVVDEAHNVCPAEPDDVMSHLSAQITVQIAAEGRKYGLYLLVSTQQPHKVQQNVVSQCDNLLLMRMNSAGDLADLERIFSFVAPGLFAGAQSFRMGQALVAGKVLPQPAYVQMGERVTHEGGADIPMTWAARR